MDHEEQPKKKRPNLWALGGLLMLGGIIVLRQASRTDRFYENIQEAGSASWASGLGWLMVVGGVFSFIAAVAWRNTE